MIFLGFGVARADLTYNYLGNSFPPGSFNSDPTLTNADHIVMSATFASNAGNVVAESLSISLVTASGSPIVTAVMQPGNCYGDGFSFDSQGNITQWAADIQASNNIRLTSEFTAYSTGNLAEDQVIDFNTVNPTFVAALWGDPGTFTAVPVPASLLLFGPGLAGLAALKRKYIG